MKAKVSSFLFLGFALLLVAGLVGGCGEQVHESSSYYYPNWMPDGRIIASKEYSQTSSTFWGSAPSELKYYISVLTVDSNNKVVKEENLFEMRDVGIVKEITSSPTGEMVGYIDDGIYITDYHGNNKRKIPGTDANVKYFDWSPDATKLVYSSNRNLYVINKDGSGQTLITSEASGPVSWRYGNTLSYGYLYLINSDGTNWKKLISGAYPQNYSINEVVYQGADGLYKINFDGNSNAKLFSDYKRYTLKLSYDNTKIVGGDLDQSLIKNVWVTDIRSGNSKRIK